MEVLATDDFDLVLSDYLTEMNGLELLREIKNRFPATTVILMTAYATVQNAVAIMKAGAQDYLTKPFSTDQVEHIVAQALEIRHLQSENRLLRYTIEESPLLDSRSPAMRRLLETAEQAAVSDATILLTGESGTGKNGLGAAAGVSMAQQATGAGKVTTPGPVLVQNAGSGAQAEAPPMVSMCGCPPLACANGTIDACYVSCDSPKKAKCTCQASCDPKSGNTSGKNSCSC